MLALQWFQALGEGAFVISNAQGTNRELLLKLVALGRSKNAENFLSDKKSHPTAAIAR
jgi:hypothetical protein